MSSIMDQPKKRPISDAERAKLAKKMDDELDDFIETLAEKSRAAGNAKPREPFDFDKWAEGLDQHPAFMSDLKPDANGEYSEHVQALQAMKYENNDEDAQETAEMAKTEGNKYFQLKKFRWARDAYTNGIKAKCPDRELNSTLFANRAAAEKHLGNLASAIRDCLFAHKLNPRNGKPMLRGAECLLELGYANRCVSWIDRCRGVLAEAGADDETTHSLDSELEQLRLKAESRRAAEERDERRRKAEERRVEQEKRLLLAAFRDRRLRFQPPIDLKAPEEFDLNEICIRSPYTKEILQDRVYVNPENLDELLWPLLLQYVGMSQTDMIKDCAESATLGDLVEPVFQQPAPWDALDFNYRLENIRLFLPLDVFEDRQVAEVSLKQTIREILSTSEHTIVYGLPIIQVYTKQKAAEELEKLTENRFRLR